MDTRHLRAWILPGLSMPKTDYTYGDGKSGDAANFGIMKQNWGMLRVCASQFKGQTAAQSSNGTILKYVSRLK
jgi:hypothetical protein